MLAVGDPAPEFDAPDATGRRVRSADLRGRAFILFFYPKAGSWGCTREAMGFAGQYSEFTARGAAVLGVSVDPPDAQQAFVSKCKLPYPLLVDSAGKIAREFGVLGAFGFARRVTFVVGPEGRILHVTDTMLPGAHVEETLKFLDRGRPPTSDRQAP